MISEGKWETIRKRMLRLGLDESDLEEKFVRSSGSGGQKVNKTSSCVWLKHSPSGLEVKCQKTRSQQDNRYFARRLLVEKLEAKILAVKTERQKKIEKLKRQKRKRSKRAKEKVLKEKKHRSKTKENRKKPGLD